MKLYPTCLRGTVAAPASKSYLHRAIIVASLVSEKSEICNFDLSNDITETIDLCRKIGAKIEVMENIKKLVIVGISKDNIQNNNLSFYIKESGTTLRFFIPILISLFPNFDLQITLGDGLIKRPLTTYEKLFSKENISFQKIDNTLLINGEFTSQTILIEGNESSQYVSGLLIAATLWNYDSQFILISELQSINYVKMTLDILKLAKIDIIEINNREFLVKGNQVIRNFIYSVEGDFSNAAFWLVAAVIGNKPITVTKLNFQSIQGDKEIINIFQKSKINYTIIDDKITVYPTIFSMDNVDLKNIPDLGPILFILSLSSTTPVKFFNYHRLKIKESDRIVAMKVNLAKLGYQITTYSDYLIIKKVENNSSEIIIDSFADHRIVMSFLIFQNISTQILEISDIKCVDKSYPNFFKDYLMLNAKEN